MSAQLKRIAWRAYARTVAALRPAYGMGTQINGHFDPTGRSPLA